MSDVSGIPAFGGGGFAYRQVEAQPTQAVPEITSGANNGSATSNRGQDLPGQNSHADQNRELTLRRAKRESLAPAQASEQGSQQNAAAQARNEEASADKAAVREDGRVELSGKDVHVGPTPAFQASVLEVDRDLRNVIAQVEAKRTQASDEAAIAPSTREDVKQDTPSQPDVSPRDQSTQQASKAEATQSDLGVKQDVERAELQQQAVQDTQRDVQTSQMVQDRESAYSGAAAAIAVPYDGA